MEFWSMRDKSVSQLENSTKENHCISMKIHRIGWIQRKEGICILVSEKNSIVKILKYGSMAKSLTCLILNTSVSSLISALILTILINRLRTIWNSKKTSGFPEKYRISQNKEEAPDRSLTGDPIQWASVKKMESENLKFLRCQIYCKTKTSLHKLTVKLNNKALNKQLAIS